MKKRFKVVAMSVAAVGLGAGALMQPVQALTVTDGRGGSVEVSSAIVDVDQGLAAWCAAAQGAAGRGITAGDPMYTTLCQ